MMRSIILLVGSASCITLPSCTPSAPEGSPSPEATAALVDRFQAELDAAWTQAQDTDENSPGATAVHGSDPGHPENVVLQPSTGGGLWRMMLGW